MKKIAIFASGNGSNFQAIVDAVKRNEINANVELLVVNKLDAYVIERAKESNIEIFAFNHKEYSSKQKYEEEILELLHTKEIDLIVLAGYMLLIGETILNNYENRIINIHPSLLPAFRGKDAIGQAIKYGVKVMGVTVHYVDSGMDTGKIIAQEAFALQSDESIEMIENKIHEIEHKLYPRVIKELIEEEN